MQKVKFSYSMELQFTQPVWNHVFSLRAFPMRLPEQQIGGVQWAVYPNAPLQFHKDYFGNTVGTGRFDEMHSSFRFELNGMAWIDQQKRKPELCLPLYQYPSEACNMTEQMKLFLHDTVDTTKLSGDNAALQQAIVLMHELYETFQYQSGSTHVATTAGEAFAQKCGVCQDYAHILIALCRAKGIAARYVAGMIFGEGASHAWVEVYDNGMWHGMDPTHNCVVNEGYLKLAHGRDAMDCKLNRGVFCGTAWQQQNVYINLEEV